MLFLKKWILESLDLQLQVNGHAFLDDQARATIVNSKIIVPLDRQKESELLRNLKVGNAALVRQVGEAAVIVDRDWRVSIHAHKLRQCMEALVILLNVLTEESRLSFSITSMQPGDARKEGLPLHEAIEQMKRREAYALAIQAVLYSLFAGLALLAIRQLF